MSARLNNVIKPLEWGDNDFYGITIDIDDHQEAIILWQEHEADALAVAATIIKALNNQEVTC